MPAARPTLNLALQGGGAHGAYTWGVLDALLEREEIGLDGVSGASAGAMNAVVMAQGWLDGGRSGARRALARFWQAIGEQMPAGFVVPPSGDEAAWPSLNPMVRAMMQWTQFVAPAQFNPLGRNPLRELLDEQVDFAALRRSQALRLFVATTHANTGRLRLFRRHELTLDAVLASACLPSIHPSVMIDGEPYWDGAFSANPPLAPLLFECRARDLLIVMLSPLRHAHTPASAAEIRERTADLAFNATFLRELQWLALSRRFGARRGGARWWPAWLRHLWPQSRIERRLNAAHFHLVAMHAAGQDAPPGETRLLAHGPFLERLRDAGRSAAQAWLARDGAALGQRSSIDLVALFGDR
jgi:NTE family protein